MNGRYTPDQALGLLLRDTELGFRRTPDGTVTIKEGFPRPQLVAATDDSLAKTRTQRSMADDAPVETLPEVLVPGFRLSRSSYIAPNASTSTKMNMPLLQTPISVQVVPRAAIDDQQAIQVEDAIKNVSGVFPGFTFGGFAEEFMIRGFNTGFANYRDGFRTQAARRSNLVLYI
ncbi:MAG: hypothetical protein NPIRA02_38190 [Nitrospirales bacterium]|nr:MAG: hypothetical protein NPIRA02_38190 [Nitrospirales bacterium]